MSSQYFFVDYLHVQLPPTLWSILCWPSAKVLAWKFTTKYPLCANVMPDTAVINLKKICLLPAIKDLQSLIRNFEYRNIEETLQHWRGTWQETAEIANIKLGLEKRNRTQYHLEVPGHCSKVAKHLICFKYSSFGTFFNIVLNFVNRNSPRASLNNPLIFLPGYYKKAWNPPFYK